MSRLFITIMPVDFQSFRVKCGVFVFIFIAFMYRRTQAKVRVQTLRIRTFHAGVTIGLLLAYIFFNNLILLCGDVERNPGPPKPDPRQTRLTSRGENDRRGSSLGRQENSGDLTLIDIMNKLTIMESQNESRFTVLRDEVKEMKDSYCKLNEEVTNLRQEVAHLQKENVDLRFENSSMKSGLEDMARKTDDLESRSKRNNLVFYGLEKGESESASECEEKVQAVLEEKLGLTNVPFDRVHRTSTDPKAPMVARCTFYKDRLSVLKAKKNLAGSTISISEDFTRRVREVRKKLVPYLKAAKRSGKKVSMVYDHLIIDGRKYFLNEDGTIDTVDDFPDEDGVVNERGGGGGR